ncbi:hypothetical protein AKJ63_01860 [candidate division MSBL1 archaeon SCGC-AAA259D18]|uniref:Transcription factor TFIIB cyclin-like domain-containing protein n=1 Tax=candidate division MSBL1 archaeon SCGC-AAA259D18 TaxID=1698262 RepID=A0A133UAC7_9EURY|nr:hypothetical protein AKJ63_01860 [candidate division MSBL1 archaeon SCGC-AAA259D18]
MLLEKKMDSRPEWHAEPGKKSGRADVSSGSDITQHDLGLGSRLGYSQDLSPAWRAKLRRLQKWHRRSRAVSYHDKSLRQALINLDKLCEDLTLPKSVKAEVSVLFRKARKKEITPGRNTWSVLTALIFIVARMRRMPRTEKEIAKALTRHSSLEEREAFRALRRIRKILAKELDLEVPRPMPEEYLDRFASRLNLPNKIKSKAHEICTSIPEEFKFKKASYLVAAGAIYNASRKFENRVKIREVANNLDVGVSSLSKTGKQIREFSAHF